MSPQVHTPGFDPAQFAAPEALLWPGYFWLWNAPLDPERLRLQLRDMASHGARSVCMLPMPRAFRPDSTNNSMEPDYLTPVFLERVRLAVEEAAALDMRWWLYDEGGWPSGHALGKVVSGRDDLRAQRVVRQAVDASAPLCVPADALALVEEPPGSAVVRPGGVWSPSSAGVTAHLYRTEALAERADLLNPAAAQRFVELTHAAYAAVLRPYLGSTVRFTFTDEPAAPAVQPGRAIPWTPAMEELLAAQAGPDALRLLPLLFAAPGGDQPPATAQARVHFFEAWTRRFAAAYFGPLQEWARAHGLGSGGHLGGEDETLGAVRHGFGQPLRQLRAMDVPGVDLIWRQVFPGGPARPHFPKLASSAAHHNGTSYAFTESFAVYGNGLTPAQMRWLVDYQYARGINLLVVGCYPLSTRDHHMTGERPHFGPVNPLWDHLTGFHAYAARLGYALCQGEPHIRTALYYPARDLWAWGERATEAVQTHDALAAELLATQRDFDLVDDDVLATARVEGGELVAGAMRYAAVVCGTVAWMRPDARTQLERFAAGGGTVLAVGVAPGTDGACGAAPCAWCGTGSAAEVASRVAPTLRLSPPGRDIRVAVRRLARGQIALLHNEGEGAYDGDVAGPGSQAYRLDAQTGTIHRAETGAKGLRVSLGPGESGLFLWSETRVPALEPRRAADGALRLDGLLQAAVRRRFVVGEHDFEVHTPEGAAVPFAAASAWADWLGPDFSGEVDYRVRFEVTQAWAGRALRLQTGPVEYAASVLLDGAVVGQLLWPPWRLDLPGCARGAHDLVIRVANTLANELTSERVAAAWSARRGPGWPSPYHARALEFERESRGGGLRGPLSLTPLDAA